MKKLLQFILVATMGFLAVGCQSPVQTPKAATGNLTITVGESTARSILPSDMTFASYSATGTLSGTGTTKTATSATATFNVTNLAAGTWVFTVNGLDGSGNVLASGSTSVLITADTTASATVQLVASPSGTGTLNLSVSWPAGKTITSVKGILTPEGGTETYITLTISGHTATYQNTALASGSYLLVLTFFNDGLYAAANWTEAVVIYRGRTSSGTYTMSSSSVIYDANGGTGTIATDSTSYSDYQKVTTAVTAGVTKSGNKFVGWNTQADGLGRSYAPGGTFTMGPNSVTLYAIWAPANLNVLSNAASNTITVTGPATQTGTVIIPNGITAIDKKAFQSDTAMTGITIPATVNTIGEAAFQGTGITSIDIPSSVTSSEMYLCASCTSLTEATFNATSLIPAYTFDGCSALKNLAIGAKVTGINGTSVMTCTSLTNITVDGANTQLSASGSAVYNKAKTELITVCQGCGPTFTIPAGITALTQQAFYQNTKLTSITIPSTIPRISDWTFYGCSNLATVTMSSATPPTLGSGVFTGHPATFVIKVPIGTSTAYQTATNWSTWAACISEQNSGTAVLTVVEPTVVTLTFTTAPTMVSYGTNPTFAATASAAPESWAWYVDGTLDTSSTTATYVCTKSLSTGSHTVTIVAKKDGNLYSQSFSFLVV